MLARLITFCDTDNHQGNLGVRHLQPSLSGSVWAIVCPRLEMTAMSLCIYVNVAKNVYALVIFAHKIYNT